MNEQRIARADVFFVGGFVAALMGRAVQVGFATPVEVAALVAVLFLAPMAGTLVALLVASRRVTPGPFVWTFVGAVGAAFVGLASVLVVYDLMLIAVAAVSTVVFLVLLGVAIIRDGRWWTRVLRLALVPATIATLALPWARIEPAGMQAVGAWLLATWPLTGAALLAPVPWALAPVLPDDCEPVCG